MRPYEKYKPSNIEWLGQIPIEWNRYRIKYCFKSINGGVWGEEPMGDENDINCLRVADFNYELGVINTGNLTVRNISPSEQINRLLKKGDLLIEKSGGGELSPVGRVVKFDLDIKAVCSNFINRLNTKKEFNSDYLNYLNKFLYSKGVSESNINQTTGIQNLKIGEYVGESVFLPPRTEQQTIVLYLDYKTKLIDDFIVNRQKQIDLLSEQKATIINKAVTKGLNNNVEMKPSGIEWIGMIPEHWRVWTISNLAKKLCNGFVGPTHDILEETGIRYLQSLHIKKNQIKFNTPYFVNEKWSEKHPRSILKKGDVLIVQTGDIGQVACVTEEFEGCNCHALIIFQVKKNMGYGEYMSTLLSSNFGYNELKRVQTGALHPHLNVGTIKYIKLTVPPREEQFEILEYIKKETAIIDDLSSKYQNQITLMQEYRTAIISNAVTGKIDVRDWKSKAKKYAAEDIPLSKATEA